MTQRAHADEERQRRTRIAIAARMATFLLGAWLAAAPDVLGHEGAARTSDQLIGPIAASFAFVAAWQVLSGLRWVAAAAGVWIVISAVALAPGAAAATNELLVGLGIVLLSLLPMPRSERFGGGWRALRP